VLESKMKTKNDVNKLDEKMGYGKLQ